MPRPEKVQAVEEIKERFENAEATFLTEYRGLTVNEQQELRRGLRATGAEYKVVKMSLRCMATGSSRREPRANAASAAVGRAKRSTSRNRAAQAADPGFLQHLAVQAHT